MEIKLTCSDYEQRGPFLVKLHEIPLKSGVQTGFAADSVLLL